ncbi:EhSyntaxin L, putative [Entamoeba histolytica HM-3:IMSS]|uniref:Ehsyntaxin L, putative n=3 Tax=Entamoeba histolytica TaxID=5759 RepID=M2RHG5_ENTHI
MSVITNEEVLINENDEQLDILQRKSAALKNATNTLLDKVSDSNKNIDETAIEMRSLVDLTNRSIEGISKVVGAKFTYRHCFYLICGLVVLLLILYFMFFKMDWFSSKVDIVPTEQN